MPVQWIGISGIYAALLALLWIVLAIRVIRLRRAGRVSLGDGGDPDLLRAVRAHGNASESIPILIALMVLVELAGLPAWLVHGLGLMAVAGRVMHGLHFGRERRGLALRVGGMLLTFASMAIAALALIGAQLIGVS